MTWVGKDGKRPILPKTNGQSIMISAFQSREFGFGLNVTDEDITKINSLRNGKHYNDNHAAIEMH